MIAITTQVGVLYMEKETEREEADRIKIYDSKERYLEYLSISSVSEYESVTQYCNKVIRHLEGCTAIEEILFYLGIESYTVGKDWTDLLEDIYTHEGYEYDEKAQKYIELPDGDEITEQSVMENEYVNVIGDLFVLNCDWR